MSENCRDSSIGSPVKVKFSKLDPDLFTQVKMSLLDWKDIISTVATVTTVAQFLTGIQGVLALTGITPFFCIFQRTSSVFHKFIIF